MMMMTTTLPSFRRSKISPPTLPITLTSSDEEDYTKPCSSKGKGKKIRKKRDSALEERVTKLEKALEAKPASCETCILVEEMFKCFVCKSIIQQDCFLLVCCKQLVCKTCITQWNATSQSCPLCRESIDIEGNAPIPRSVLELILLLSKKELSAE